METTYPSIKGPTFEQLGQSSSVGRRSRVRGPFDRELVAGVREGVVAKGTFSRRDKEEVWCAKVKTQSWLDELTRRAGQSDGLRGQLVDNLREQNLSAPTAETPDAPG